MSNKSTTTVCHFCGITFPVAPYKLRDGRPRYCSKSHAYADRKNLARPLADLFWPHVDKSGECWIWTGLRDSNGYGRLANPYTSGLAHRIAYELTIGPIPDGLYLCHNCPGGDNPSCVRPTHMFIGNQFDNMGDAVRKGRMPTGERHYTHDHPEWGARGTQVWNAKMTPEGVRDVRRRYAAGGITQLELGREYGMTDTGIARIVLRQTWAWVDD